MEKTEGVPKEPLDRIGLKGPRFLLPKICTPKIFTSIESAPV